MAYPSQLLQEASWGTRPLLTCKPEEVQSVSMINVSSRSNSYIARGNLAIKLSEGFGPVKAYVPDVKIMKSHTDVCAKCDYLCDCDRHACAEETTRKATSDLAYTPNKLRRNA